MSPLLALLKFIVKISLIRLFEWCLLLVIVPYCLWCRTRAARRPFDVGIGPEPLINNVYHKKALQLYGYKCETFVNHIYFITEQFDVRADQFFNGRYPALRNLVLFSQILAKYRIIYLYFHGGPLYFTEFQLLKKLEPKFYKWANVKVLVMPYGSDIQEESRSSNLLYKHALCTDYPNFKTQREAVGRRIDMWTIDASHVISGCDWVDYMYHWDTLMLGHFSIDLDQWSETEPIENEPHQGRPFRILHAPNHKTIKGTSFFLQAVADLKDEGCDIELVIIQGVPNEKIRQEMREADLIADQLVIGWYAMFAIEAMSMAKPVLCYLRQDFVDLYTFAGLITPGEIPILQCSTATVKEKIREAYDNRHALRDIGLASREFVRRHHSLESVGAVFRDINLALGCSPSAQKVPSP